MRVAKNSTYFATLWSLAAIVGLILSSLLFGLAFQRITVLATIDTYLYQLIFHMPHPNIISLLARPFDYNLFFHVPGLPEQLPTSFYFLVAAIAIYLWIYRRRDAVWFLLAVAFGNTLVHLVTLIDTHLIFRERPFLVLHQVINSFDYNAWKNLSSYPSGHSRDIALYSTLIAFYVRWFKWPAIVLVLFIMFTRVYEGAHYPSDTIAGAAIGIAAAFEAKVVAEWLRDFYARTQRVRAARS